jgi:hypothetical protein
MNLHPDQLLRLPQQLSGQHAHARRPIADLIVLHLRDVHQDLGRGVVELDGFEDRRAVVCNVDDWRILFMPLGPSVDLTRSPMAMAPTNEVRRAFSAFSSVA